MQTVLAKLTVHTESDGTVVLTLNAPGDLAAEIVGNRYSTVTTSLLAPAVNATKLKVVTASGVKMSTDDMDRLCGEDNTGKYQRFHMTELDLSEAVLQDENSLKGLGYITSMKKVTYPATTTFIPTTYSEGSICKIQEVVIPDNASISLKLDQQAFHTTSLRKITFGARNGINIGTLAFQGDTNLTSVDFHYGSKNIVIGNQAFDRCPALANIVLPEGVTEIGAGAFLNSGVQTIRLPNSLKTIRTKAFAGCTELKTITIPEGVEQIETAAFENNYNLSDVYVLGLHTKCAEGAFSDNNTYQYTVGAYTDGQTNFSINNYKPEGKDMKTRTVLHYREAAYKDYTNEYLQLIGTDKYATTAPYKDSPELNHWVYDSDGNKLPVVHSDNFEGNKVGQGPYAGWRNFMIVDGKLDDNIYDDDVRVRDKWYSMCLPFDMTAEQLKSAYGDLVEIVEFSGAKTYREDGTKYLTLSFKKPVHCTKAHHPYMIHPAMHSGEETGVKATIVGIKKQPETDEVLECNSVTIREDGVDYTFIGNYTANRQIPANSYYYYNGSGATNGSYAPGFYKRVQAGGTWGRYTAIVRASADDGVRAKSNTLFYEEVADYGQTTGIDAIATPASMQAQGAAAGKVYNLQGQVVRTDSDSLDGLPAGLYIVNGKKYMVK